MYRKLESWITLAVLLTFVPHSLEAEFTPLEGLSQRLEEHLSARKQELLEDALAHYALIYAVSNSQLEEWAKPLVIFKGSTGLSLGTKGALEPHGGGNLREIFLHWRPYGVEAASHESSFEFSMGYFSLGKLLDSAKKQVVLRNPSIEGVLPEVKVGHQDWSSEKKFAYLDAYSLLLLLLEVEPDLHAEWINVEGQKLSTYRLLDSTWRYYTKNKQSKAFLTSELPKHSDLHMIEVLLAFAKRSNKHDANELKKRFLANELKYHSVDETAFHSFLSHFIEMLGHLLEEPAVTWSEAERHQVVDWLSAIHKPYRDLHRIQLPPLTHTLRGVRLIGKNLKKLGIHSSHPFIKYGTKKELNSLLDGYPYDVPIAIGDSRRKNAIDSLSTGLRNRDWTQIEAPKAVFEHQLKRKRLDRSLIGGDLNPFDIAPPDRWLNFLEKKIRTSKDLSPQALNILGSLSKNITFTLRLMSDSKVGRLRLTPYQDAIQNYLRLIRTVYRDYDFVREGFFSWASNLFKGGQKDATIQFHGALLHSASFLEDIQALHVARRVLLHSMAVNEKPDALAKNIFFSFDLDKLPPSKRATYEWDQYQVAHHLAKTDPMLYLDRTVSGAMKRYARYNRNQIAPQITEAWSVPRPIRRVSRIQPQRLLKQAKALTPTELDKLNSKQGGSFGQGIYQIFAIPTLKPQTVSWQGQATGNKQVFLEVWTHGKWKRLKEKTLNPYKGQVIEFKGTPDPKTGLLYFKVNVTDGDIETKRVRTSRGRARN